MTPMPQMSRAGQIGRIKANAAERREEDLAKQRVTVRCAHCTGPGRRFKFTGPVRKAQARFTEHRALAHPELPSFAEARLTQAKKHRVHTKGTAVRAHSYTKRREFLSEDELQLREVLRREGRTDLPPLIVEEAVA